MISNTIRALVISGVVATVASVPVQVAEATGSSNEQVSNYVDTVAREVPVTSADANSAGHRLFLNTNDGNEGFTVFLPPILVGNSGDNVKRDKPTNACFIQ